MPRHPRKSDHKYNGSGLERELYKMKAKLRKMEKAVRSTKKTRNTPSPSRSRSPRASRYRSRSPDDRRIENHLVPRPVLRYNISSESEGERGRDYFTEGGSKFETHPSDDISDDERCLQSLTALRQVLSSISSEEGEIDGDFIERDRKFERHSSYDIPGTVSDNSPASNNIPIEEQENSSSLSKRRTSSLFENEVTNNADRLGPPVQEYMARTWTSIIENGMGSTERQTLISSYPVPENAGRFRTPKLNDVLVNVIRETALRRDIRLAELQQQITTSLTAVGTAVSAILSEEGGGNKAYLHPLVDAGRLLADLLHKETTSRKALASFDLDKTLKETLIASPSDDWLFGTDLENRVEDWPQMSGAVQNKKPKKNTKMFRDNRGNNSNLNYRGKWTKSYYSRSRYHNE